jgi:hypothetical protein
MLQQILNEFEGEKIQVSRDSGEGWISMNRRNQDCTGREKEQEDGIEMNGARGTFTTQDSSPGTWIACLASSASG